MGESARSYFALGPLAIDRVLQFFFVGYKQWASAHGLWRRRLVLTVALLGIVWVQFWAFHAAYVEQHSAAALAQRRLEQIQGKDGTGGLQKEIQDLRGTVQAKDKEIEAAKSAKTRTVYVQVPPPPVTVHVDSSGAYVQSHLSDAQKTKLRESLQPLLPEFKGKKFILFASNFDRASIYARDFRKLFKECGIDVQGPEIAGADSENDRGVLVGLRYPDHPSDLSLRFIAAIKAAGIDVETTLWGEKGEQMVVPPDFLDFDLFIVE
jgi:hypothetical protein